MFRYLKKNGSTVDRTIRGATLLEVMVALVVMSIGLLGLASLQLAGIRANSNSENRTQAAIIANDLAERMRANPDAVANGNYAAVKFGGIKCKTPPAAICQNHGAAASNCNTAQMAIFDAFAARCNAMNSLQSGTLTVSCTDSKGVSQTCTSTPYRTVEITWSNQVDGGSVSKSLRMTFRP